MDLCTFSARFIFDSLRSLLGVGPLNRSPIKARWYIYVRNFAMQCFIYAPPSPCHRDLDGLQKDNIYNLIEKVPLDMYYLYMIRLY